MRPRTRPLRPIPEIVASHLQFAIDVLKETPRMMVLQNQTPWCHPSLYKKQMPRAMQDAYACCSLYMSKTEINAPVIMSLFDNRTRELVESPEPTDTREILARTHALILYQIMRLFDSDIGAQATTEALFTTLEASVLTLLRTIYIPDPKQSTELLPFFMNPTIEFWESWVLQESARRTVLLTYYFMQIYKLLHGMTPVQCDGKLGIFGDHAWYLSAHLWNAQSAFDFAIAWAEREHFIVYNLDFTLALMNAQPSDLDLFGKMLLVTVLGLDNARAWFHVRGAIL
ncbi:hypothetical protein N7448_005334 [Penicillium atrosanguineum]|nr:uncharacterized protein N7443_009064 [Penicillium atrosanguineum]KAJ5136780.1 hypothetical protein N7448_005334 [Penicillium atrosanguineum]KAJ5293111.1 hypothetical protein N7443_009064 [Penicillium atrosanguineum]